MNRMPISQWEAHRRRERRRAIIHAVAAWVLILTIALAFGIGVARVATFIAAGCVR